MPCPPNTSPPPDNEISDVCTRHVIQPYKDITVAGQYHTPPGTPPPPLTSCLPAMTCRLRRTPPGSVLPPPDIWPRSQFTQIPESRRRLCGRVYSHSPKTVDFCVFPQRHGRRTPPGPTGLHAQYRKGGGTYISLVIPNRLPSAAAIWQTAIKTAEARLSVWPSPPALQPAKRRTRSQLSEGFLTRRWNSVVGDNQTLFPKKDIGRPHLCMISLLPCPILSLCSDQQIHHLRTG